MRTLEDPQDVKCDDLGQWKITGSKKLYFALDDEKKLQEIEEEEINHHNRLHRINRTYYRDVRLPSLGKSIAMGENLQGGQNLNIIFVQYIFTDGEQKVQVEAHGNSKRIAPKIRLIRGLWKARSNSFEMK